MRILILSPGFFETDIGGVATVVRHLALGLVERGHQVMVCTTPNGGHPRSGQWRGIGYRQVPFRYRTAPMDCRQALRTLRQFRPELLNVHYPIGGQGVVALALHVRTGLPLVSSLHAREMAHDNVIDRWVAHLTVQASRSMIANSRFTIAEALGAIRGGIVLIYNGVTMRTCTMAKKERGPYIAAAGSLAPHKNFASLVRSFRKIAQRYPRISLKIAGTGPQESELMTLAASLGVADRVSFLGQLRPSEVERLFAAALLVVVPSWMESFGLVALEAMAVGTPVVVAGYGGLPEIVRDGIDGLLVNAFDPDAIGSAIDRVLKDRALWQELSRGARRRAAEFTWDRTAESYIAVFERVVSKQ